MDYPALRVSYRALLSRNAVSQKYKNENVNTARSLEADRIEQVGIFMFLSRTEAIESVTFAWNTVDIKCVLTFVEICWN